MKVFTILSLFLILISCSRPGDNLQYLEGYWEIEKVKLASGAVKEYSVNLTIDYFHCEGNTKGYRKKVQPALDGTYITSDDAVHFLINNQRNDLVLTYEKEGNVWKEVIKKLEPDVLIIANHQNNTYFYKRFRNIQLPK